MNPFSANLTIGDIGEKQFLRSILPTLFAAPNFVNGFGGDTGIIDLGFEENIAFNIDRAPYPVSLKRGWGNHATWGRLAVVANVSDLIASAAKPEAFMISIIVPRDYLANYVKQIIDGAAQACLEFGISFLGGDTKEGLVPQVVGSSFGRIDKVYYHRRRKAAPGDKLVIAGQLGGFMAALALADKFGPDDSGFREWVRYMKYPKPRIKESKIINRLRLAKSAVDITDGLADVVDTFCEKNTGILVSTKDLPLHPFAKDAIRRIGSLPVELALSVGDWAIAYVVEEKMLAVLRSISAKSELSINVVGEFNDGGEWLLIKDDGSLHNLPKTINEQFVSRLEDN